MKKPNKFEVIMNIWISVIINVVLAIVLPLAAMGMINLKIFLIGFAIAFPVSTVLVFVLPITALGNKFAHACGAAENSVPEKLLSTIIVALILCTALSLMMTAINLPPGVPFIPAWLHAYPWAMISVYGSALLGIFTGVPFTKAILRIPKDADGAPGSPRR
jgi:hypothetical protein